MITNFRTNVDDEYRKSTNAKRVRSDITKTTRQVFKTCPKINMHFSFSSPLNPVSFPVFWLSSFSLY